MSKTLLGGGACCHPRIEGITYLEIGTLKTRVGMMDLEAVFQQLYALGRRPEETTDAELVGMARKSNYIPERADTENGYAVALRRAYARYYARQEEKQ